MLSERIIQEIIAEKDETNFRKFLKEFFIKKGFKHVEITHGPFEKGKDIICYDYSDRLGEIWCGFVVKAGGIGGGTSHSSDLDVIIASTLEALKKDFSHPLDPKKCCRIQKLFIITNGNFTKGAEQKIRNEIKYGCMFSNIECWGLERVAKEVQQHCPELIECEFPFLLRYFEQVDRSLSQPSELLVFSEIHEIDLNQIFVDPVLKKVDDVAINTLDDVAQQIGKIVVFQQKLE